MASYFILTLAVLTVVLELRVVNTQGLQLRYHDPCTNSQMTCGSNMTCRQRLCECLPGFFPHIYTCSQSLAPDTKCDPTLFDSRQCVDNARCNVHTRICECVTGYYSNGTACKTPLLKYNATCNSSRAVQCALPAVCNKITSTCDCPLAHFNNNKGICTPRISLYSKCDFHEPNHRQCVDDTACTKSGTEYACMCQSGFFVNGTHCSPRLKVGYPCDYRVRDPMQCLNNSHCPPRGHGSACTCDIGYFQNGARCDLAILDGNSCDKTVPDPKQCVTNASCQENSTNTSICRCNDNFFNHFSSCQPRLAPMQACDIISRIGDNQCFDNATCDHILRICVCKPGLFLNTVEGTCKEGLKVGDHCDYRIRDPLQCLNNSHCPLSGQGSTCTCDNRYFQNDTHCDLVRLAGHTCDRKIVDPPQCVSNSQCGNTSICLCKEGFYNNSGVCAVRLLPLARCNPSVPDDKQCVDSVTCDPNLHVCICHNGLFPDVVKGTCDNVTLGRCSTLTSNVTHIEECPDHAHCVNDSCRCDIGFKEDNSQTCVPDIQKVPAGLQCNTTTDKCVSNATCSSVGQVSVCHCDVDFYDRAGQCVRRLRHGEVCFPLLSDPRQCVDGARCVPSSGQYECVCQLGFYIYLKECHPSQLSGEACDASLTQKGATNQCVDNASCLTGRCACNDGYFNNSGYCQRKVQLGRQCDNHLKQCEGLNVGCDHTSLVCACITNFYNNQGVCVRRYGLGEPCDSSVNNSKQCDDPNAECVPSNTTTPVSSTCVCKSTHEALPGQNECTEKQTTAAASTSTQNQGLVLGGSLGGATFAIVAISVVIIVILGRRLKHNFSENSDGSQETPSSECTEFQTGRPQDSLPRTSVPMKQFPQYRMHANPSFATSQFQVPLARGR